MIGNDFVNQEKELQNIIDYYKRLVDAKLKMLEDEEIELLISERDSIHDIISSLPDNEAGAYEERIRSIDYNLVSQIDTVDMSRFNHTEYAPELWWWHLSKFSDLTSEQKSTL